MLIGFLGNQGPRGDTHLDARRRGATRWVERPGGCAIRAAGCRGESLLGITGRTEGPGHHAAGGRGVSEHGFHSACQRTEVYYGWGVHGQTCCGHERAWLGGSVQNGAPRRPGPILPTAQSRRAAAQSTWTLGSRTQHPWDRSYLSDASRIEAATCRDHPQPTWSLSRPAVAERLGSTRACPVILARFRLIRAIRPKVDSDCQSLACYLGVRDLGGRQA